jgi:phosphate-selective porin OprO/OprP
VKKRLNALRIARFPAKALLPYLLLSTSTAAGQDGPASPPIVAPATRPAGDAPPGAAPAPIQPAAPAPIRPAAPAPIRPAAPAPIQPAAPVPIQPAAPAPIQPAAPAPIQPATPAPVQPAAPAPVQPAVTTRKSEADRAHPSPPKLELLSADGAHRVRFAGLLQADLRAFFADSGVTTFAVRRARPILEGHAYRYVEFRLQTDVAGGRLQLLDAYANLHFVDEVQLLVGKAKGPILLERLQSPQNITFAERAFPTLLGPNRDVGAKLHGKVLGGTIEWAFGVYNGVPNGQSGDLDTNDAKDVEARLFLLPHEALDVSSFEIGLGGALAIGNQQSALPSYVTSGQQAFFAYGSAATAFGRRTILTPQAYAYFGPLGLLSELVRVREHIVSTSGATGTVGSTAFQIAGSVVVGGKPSYKGVKVARPVGSHDGGIGAFELSARYHSLRIGDLAYRRGFANRVTAAAVARAFTIGGSWHLADGQRALVNYERTTFRGGADNGGNKTPESVLISRLQAYF